MTTIDTLTGSRTSVATVDSWTLAQEADLVARVQAGDERACRSLVEAFGGRMRCVARRMIRCEADCDDAVQEAFMSAFQSIGEFKRHCRLSTWLHRIVVNTCLMRLRSRSARGTISIEDLRFGLEGAEGRSPSRVACALDVGGAVAKQEMHARVRAVIEDLPPAYREVILLRDIQERDTDSTAQLLGTSRANVKTRLHRARMALRPRLESIFQGTYEPVRAA